MMKKKKKKKKKKRLCNLIQFVIIKKNKLFLLDEINSRKKFNYKNKENTEYFWPLNIGTIRN